MRLKNKVLYKIVYIEQNTDYSLKKDGEITLQEITSKGKPVDEEKAEFIYTTVSKLKEVVKRFKLKWGYVLYGIAHDEEIFIMVKKPRKRKKRWKKLNKIFMQKIKKDWLENKEDEI